MNLRLHFLMIALLGSGLSLAAFSVNAQAPSPGEAPSSSPGMGMDKGMGMGMDKGMGMGMEKRGGPLNSRFSPADRAAFFDAHIAALHAGLQLAPDQEKLWPAVETALRNGAESARTRHQKMRSEPRPADAVAWLRRMSENDLAKGETLKALADAAAPLYASLSDEQKHRLPFLLHGIRPHALASHFSAQDRSEDNAEDRNEDNEGVDSRDGRGHDRDQYDEDEDHSQGQHDHD